MPQLAHMIATADFSKLSKKTGVDIKRLKALAAGEEPTLGELRRISGGLRLSLDDLVAPSNSTESAQLLFRNANLEDRPYLLDRLSRKIGYSLDILQVPKSAEWLSAFNVAEESFSEAEQSAARFRQMFYRDDQVSPLFDLSELLANDLNVIVFAINANEIDGASAYFKRTPFIFVSFRFPPRMLFTIGHELGHLIAHREHLDDFAVVDRATNDFEVRSARTRSERFAHAFASCLLMPAAGIGIALKKVRQLGTIPDGPVGDIELLYLSRIFGVSFEAAARRCEDLELLPKGSGASINRKLKERYGSAEQRAEALGLPPRPKMRFPKIPDQLLDSAVERVKAGELSVGKASAILGVSISELISVNAPTAH